MIMNPSLFEISDWCIVHGNADSKHLILGTHDMSAFDAFIAPFRRENNGLPDFVNFSRCPCPSLRFGTRTRTLAFVDVEGLAKEAAKFLGLPPFLAPTLIGAEKIRFFIRYRIVHTFSNIRSSGRVNLPRHSMPSVLTVPRSIIYQFWSFAMMQVLSSKSQVCAFILSWSSMMLIMS